jgi:hypothetical protein
VPQLPTAPALDAPLADPDPERRPAPGAAGTRGLRSEDVAEVADGTATAPQPPSDGGPRSAPRVRVGAPAERHPLPPPL